jgi:hypothetical protein
MIEVFALASLLSFVPFTGEADVPCSDGPEQRRAATLEELYEGGRSYTDFLREASRRADIWHGNTEKSDGIDAALVARARAVPGTWRFLAVAIDSCSDSVSTIPYLARLVSMVESLDMRIVDPTSGWAIMESHVTADGRASTPTVLLLDDHFEEAGCFIERPPALKTWILENELSREELYERKMAWYADDSGQDTLEAFVTMLEAAARGSSVCQA